MTNTRWEGDPQPRGSSILHHARQKIAAGDHEGTAAPGPQSLKAEPRFPLIQPSPEWSYPPSAEIVSLLSDLPEGELTQNVEVPMTLVLEGDRASITQLLDELESGGQGLDLDGWGRLYVGWGSATAELQ